MSPINTEFKVSLARFERSSALALLFFVLLLCSMVSASEDGLQQRYDEVEKGYAAVEAGEHDKAAEHFKAALEVPLTPVEEDRALPPRRQLIKARYYSLKAGGQVELADKELSEAADKFADDIDLHREFGYRLIAKQETGEAAARFKIICDLYPFELDDCRQAGYLFSQDGDDAQAAKIFSEICDRNPDLLDDCRQSAYLYLAVPDTPSALRIFKEILDEHPSERDVRKEFAYLLLAAEAKDEALTQFRILAYQDPDDIDNRMQIVYLLLDLGRRQEAREEMAAILEKDPERHALRLEMAYLMHDAEDETAKEQFQIVADQDDDKESKIKAQDALSTIEGATPSLWWGDVYAHLFFTARFPNLVLTGRVREGINIPVVPMRVYAGLRLTRDVRSLGIAGTGINEDNVLLPHLGLDVAPLWLWFPNFQLFFEIGPAIYLYDRDGNQVELDMRAGAAIYYEWMHTKPIANPPGVTIWPLTYWGEIYTDLIWFSRFNNNWIGFLTMSHGINLFQVGMLLDQIYFKTNFKYDVDGVFYNNLAELGVGMRVMPWDWLNLRFYAEYLMGFYIDRKNFVHDPLEHYYTDYWVGVMTRKDDNPYDTPYHDFRLGLLIYHDW